jgi:hypothetical protein
MTPRLRTKFPTATEVKVDPDRRCIAVALRITNCGRFAESTPQCPTPATDRETRDALADPAHEWS